MNPIFIPGDKPFCNNPYPAFHAIRERDPVSWNPRTHEWFVSRYDDVSDLMKSSKCDANNIPEWSSLLNRRFDEDLGSVERLTPYVLFYSNPPNHTQLRKAVVEIINKKLFESLRPIIRRVTDGLLNEIQTSKEFDVIADFADPLPAKVIAKSFGIPDQDFDYTRRLLKDIKPLLANYNSLHIFSKMNSAMTELGDYLDSLLALRRKQPSSDLLTAFSQLRVQEKISSRDELISILITLWVSGVETTVHSIGNGIYTLMRFPDQMDLLRKKPALIHNAFEELLRYESPLSVIGRIANEAISLQGKTINPGEKILLSIAAANRDPSVYPDPDTCDIERRAAPNLAFGKGIHFCIASALARMEGPIAINSFIARFRAIRLQAEAVEWDEKMVLRGLKSLPICTAV